MALRRVKKKKFANSETKVTKNSAKTRKGSSSKSNTKAQLTKKSCANPFCKTRDNSVDVAFLNNSYCCDDRRCQLFRALIHHTSGVCKPALTEKEELHSGGSYSSTSDFVIPKISSKKVDKVVKRISKGNEVAGDGSNSMNNKAIKHKAPLHDKDPIKSVSVSSAISSDKGRDDSKKSSLCTNVVNDAQNNPSRKNSADSVNNINKIAKKPKAKLSLQEYHRRSLIESAKDTISKKIPPTQSFTKSSKTTLPASDASKPSTSVSSYHTVSSNDFSESQRSSHFQQQHQSNTHTSKFTSKSNSTIPASSQHDNPIVTNENSFSPTRDTISQKQVNKVVDHDSTDESYTNKPYSSNSVSSSSQYDNHSSQNLQTNHRYESSHRNYPSSESSSFTQPSNYHSPQKDNRPQFQASNENNLYNSHANHAAAFRGNSDRVNWNSTSNFRTIDDRNHHEMQSRSESNLEFNHSYNNSYHRPPSYENYPRNAPQCRENNRDQPFPRDFRPWGEFEPFVNKADKRYSIDDHDDRHKYDYSSNQVDDRLRNSSDASYNSPRSFGSEGTSNRRFDGEQGVNSRNVNVVEKQKEQEKEEENAQVEFFPLLAAAKVKYNLIQQLRGDIFHRIKHIRNKVKKGRKLRFYIDLVKHFNGITNPHLKVTIDVGERKGEIKVDGKKWYHVITATTTDAYVTLLNWLCDQADGWGVLLNEIKDLNTFDEIEYAVKSKRLLQFKKSSSMEDGVYWYSYLIGNIVVAKCSGGDSTTLYKKCEEEAFYFLHKCQQQRFFSTNSYFNKKRSRDNDNYNSNRYQRRRRSRSRSPEDVRSRPRSRSPEEIRSKPSSRSQEERRTSGQKGTSTILSNRKESTTSSKDSDGSKVYYTLLNEDEKYNESASSTNSTLIRENNNNQQRTVITIDDDEEDEEMKEKDGDDLVIERISATQKTTDKEEVLIGQNNQLAVDIVVFFCCMLQRVSAVGVEGLKQLTKHEIPIPKTTYIEFFKNVKEVAKPKFTFSANLSWESAFLNKEWSGNIVINKLKWYEVKERQSRDVLIYDELCTELQKEQTQWHTLIKLARITKSVKEFQCIVDRFNNESLGLCKIQVFYETVHCGVVCSTRVGNKLVIGSGIGETPEIAKTHSDQSAFHFLNKCLVEIDEYLVTIEKKKKPPLREVIPTPSLQSNIPSSPDQDAKFSSENSDMDVSDEELSFYYEKNVEQSHPSSGATSSTESDLNSRKTSFLSDTLWK